MAILAKAAPGFVFGLNDDAVATIEAWFDHAPTYLASTLDQLHRPDIDSRPTSVLDADLTFTLSALRVVGAFLAERRHLRARLGDYASAVRAHELLLSELRPSPAWQDIGSLIQPPSPDSHTWPRSIPEMEELLRSILLRVPEFTQVACNPAVELTWYKLPFAEVTLLLRSPLIAGLGSFSGDKMLEARDRWMSAPLLSWLLYPCSIWPDHRASYAGTSLGFPLLTRLKTIPGDVVDLSWLGQYTGRGAAKGASAAAATLFIRSVFGSGADPVLAAAIGGFLASLLSDWIEIRPRR